MNELYTIGHSTHATETFTGLLSTHSITAICDVRSQPFSKFNPQFNREVIQAELTKNGIAYVFLGKELGPRSDDPACYSEGKAQYNRIAKTDLFQQGLKRIIKGMETYRIALMCAEKDPVMCHRTILVCRHLREQGIKIKHIMEDGSIEENSDTIRRLMQMLKIQETNLFQSTEEIIQSAYDIQSEKIAYADTNREENGKRQT
jgi:uncharacterized protein (DUF488 family)